MDPKLLVLILQLIQLLLEGCQAETKKGTKP